MGDVPLHLGKRSASVGDVHLEEASLYRNGEQRVKQRVVDRGLTQRLTRDVAYVSVNAWVKTRTRAHTILLYTHTVCLYMLLFSSLVPLLLTLHAGSCIFLSTYSWKFSQCTSLSPCSPATFRNVSRGTNHSGAPTASIVTPSSVTLSDNVNWYRSPWTPARAVPLIVLTDRHTAGSTLVLSLFSESPHQITS